MKSAPAITFEYAPSRWLAAAIVAIALLALTAVAFAGLGAWMKLALGCAVVAYAARALQRHLGASTLRVAWQEAGHWRIAPADGEERVAELRHAVIRGAWLVLTLRAGNGERVALILGPDNSDADVRRRLRVRLARARDAATAA
jgi:toxin CptA